MILSKRERYIAIGVGASLGILLLNYIVISPYFSSLEKISKDDAIATETLRRGADTLDHQRHYRPIWLAMQAGGVKVDASAAESQLLHALQVWATDAKLTLVSLRPERNTVENKFQLISYRATATGGMPAISRMLWQIETATIPVRINDVEISPRKEGIDDLSVQFGVSTLCQLPDTDKSKATGGTNTQ